MTASSNLEYCVLRYAPNVIGREGVSIAAIFIDPSDQVCATIFVPHWQEIVRLFDPDSDLEMLAAMLSDIRERLLSPGNRDMLRTIEDSFSNVIQVSERRRCPIAANLGSVEAFAHALLEKTSTRVVGSSVMRAPPAMCNPRQSNNWN